MRRARGHSTTHWIAIFAALALSTILAPEARPSAATPQQSSSSSSSSPGTSKKKTKKHHAKREPSQKAPTPQRISEIQSALARNGYYHGEPNGKWDANTIAAMQKFQSDNGIDPSGRLNASSLQKLGLGSSTAGVSAPKPVSTQPAPPMPATPPPPAASSAPPAAAAPTSTSTSASAPTAATGATIASTASTAPSVASSASAPKPPQR